MGEETLEDIVIPAWKFDSFAEDLMAKLSMTDSFDDLVEIKEYTDGSTLPILKTDVEGKRVYVAASPRSGESTEIKRDKLYHMFKATGLAAQENGAVEVIGVMSEYFYARSHKQKKGEGRFARQMAHELSSSGFDKVLTMAIHSTDLYSFFEEAYQVEDGKKVLYSLDPALPQTDILLNALHQSNLLHEKPLIFAGVDEGAKVWVERHKSYSPKNNTDIKEFYFDKKRLNPNNLQQTTSKIRERSDNLESLQGSVLFIPDDMADTCGSLFRTMETIEKADLGKPDYVIAALPHALLNEAAHKIIKSLGINLIASTSNPTRRTKPHITELPIFWYNPVDYFHQAIEKCIKKDQTTEEVFNPSNYPLNTAQQLYTIEQEPPQLIKYKGDFNPANFL